MDSGWFEIANILRRKTTSIAIFLLIGIGLSATPAFAATPLESKAVTRWFCSSLDGTFDFTKLVESFPFERLGAVSTSRQPIVRSGNEKESTSTSVEQSAKSQNFVVNFRYQYRNDNVTHPFGFTLQIRPTAFDPNSDPSAFARSWLESLGKVEYQNTFPVVGVGEKQQIIGYVTYFSYFSGTSTMNMNWFEASQLAGFSAVCQVH